MNDLISRSALINKIEAYCIESQDVKFIKNMIKEAPTVEAKPVVKGEWIKNTAGYYVCSNCRQLAKGDMTGCFKDRKFRQERTNFCPNCGADMRKKVE